MSVLDLLHLVDRDPDVSLTLPAPAKWLSSNQRGNWSAHHRETAAWRSAGAWYADYLGCKSMSRAYAVAELRFRTRRRRDPMNYWPTVKAVFDGFVDAGVLPDDNAERLIGPDIRVGPVIEPERLIVHLWEIS